MGLCGAVSPHDLKTHCLTSPLIHRAIDNPNSWQTFSYVVLCFIDFAGLPLVYGRLLPPPLMGSPHCFVESYSATVEIASPTVPLTVPYILVYGCSNCLHVLIMMAWMMMAGLLSSRRPTLDGHEDFLGCRVTLRNPGRDLS